MQGLDSTVSDMRNEMLCSRRFNYFHLIWEMYLQIYFTRQCSGGLTPVRTMRKSPMRAPALSAA